MNGNHDTAAALCAAMNSVATDIVDTHKQIGVYLCIMFWLKASLASSVGLL